MSLDDFKGGVGQKAGIKYKKDKLNRDKLCPRCGDEADRMRKHEWRCENKDCNVNYYITSPYEIDLL